MTVASVEAWVERKRRNERVVAIVTSALALGAGLVVTAITFLVLYATVSLLLIVVLHGQVSTRMSIALATLLLGLIWFDGARARREELPGHLGAGLWVIRECYCAGPWLILSACHNAARAFRLARIDISRCAQVLSFLASRNNSASKEDVLRVLPGIEWAQIVAELLLLDGVLFFRPELSRVGLTEPLRLELRKLIPPKAPTTDRERPAEPIPRNDPQKLSCYELLGISPAASLGEIKLAYRKRMKECHPDRFATVGKEYQQLAEEWTKAINAAYEMLLAREAGDLP